MFNLTGTVGKVELVSTFKPGRHIVVTLAEHPCDDASKRILKLSIYPLQISFGNINTCDHCNDVETKPYLDSLKNMFANKCLQSLRLIWKQDFTTAVCESWNVSNNRDNAGDLKQLSIDQTLSEDNRND